MSVFQPMAWKSAMAGFAPAQERIIIGRQGFKSPAVLSHDKVGAGYEVNSGRQLGGLYIGKADIRDIAVR